MSENYYLKRQRWFERIDSEPLDKLALELFEIQYAEIPIYRRWCDLLNSTTPACIEEIPFLPIAAFKVHKIYRKNLEHDKVFYSSGTSTQIPSRHYIFNEQHYRRYSTKLAEKILGPLEGVRVIGLLPGYGTYGSSSLISMVKGWVEESNHPDSGLINDYREISLPADEPSVLIGVTHALLKIPDEVNLSSTIVLETGGMKGMAEELSKVALHKKLNEKLKPYKLISEYGMTELYSQSYSDISEKFTPAYSQKFMAGDIRDPFYVKQKGRGRALIIDLGNYDSCAFIAAEDLIDLKKDGGFEVLGRIEGSEWRGCNLMAL